MKAVLAFDSYKGCISASEACRCAAEAIHEVSPTAETVECPLSDGGEGLVECVEHFLPVTRVQLTVHGPMASAEDANWIKASYAISADGKTAYMEMAAASGLTLVPAARRNPMTATTYGVGDMITDAVRHGVEHIIMGIGGSATSDGGRGMVESLKNAGLLDSNGRILSDCKFTVACDVTNPLYGENGAAYVYAPQKGASPEQVILLDQQLRCFARETEEAGLATPELSFHPGAGAAGGLGYGLMAYLGAELKSGIDLVLDIIGFDILIQNADVVITGEGKSDEQTLMGKLPEGVLKRCRAKNIPVWLISGSIVDSSHTLADNFNVVRSINEGDNRPLDELLQPSVAKENLRNTIQRLLPNPSQRRESAL